MRFRSREVERVEETWKQFVPSAVLHDVDPRRFLFDWHSEDLGGVSLVRYDLAAEVRSTAEPADQLLACRVDAVDGRISSAGAELDPARPWLTDGPRVHARWEHGARVTALVFDRTAVQEHARRISGDDRLVLRVTDLAPRDARSAEAWERMFAYLEDASATLTGDGDALLRAELGRHAVAMTLGAFPTTLQDAVRRPAQRSAAPATVRRALDFIADNAHQAITVEDVAAASHISTRGLQYAFRRALDTTPAECLRKARLDGAHRELQTGKPVRIPDLARRWGFAHPSRFAAAYRDVYGVSPSVTAQRHRR
ncbi:helix-turn-helix transcriptional regulator [Microbacterium hydrocarbonoxydans]|uniref:helix-turn-helix transcriptional regulator n=1 Tax=Microbacterium hydrocarbonoxydans TaxID=273678 RepID=UPI0013DD2506|nr:AraC family transcriptional regulator [Microbacterium hydrocarbonoxydans]